MSGTDCHATPSHTVDSLTTDLPLHLVGVVGWSGVFSGARQHWLVMLAQPRLSPGTKFGRSDYPPRASDRILATTTCHAMPNDVTLQFIWDDHTAASAWPYTAPTPQKGKQIAAAVV
jgi:hypothetical protein